MTGQYVRERRIQERYFEILRNYVARQGEEDLFAAAELGRKLMLADVPPEDIVELHEDALRRLADESPSMILLDVAPYITTCIMEMLMAYSLAFRAQNEQLQQEIEERKRAEDMLAQHTRELAHSNAELQRFAYVVSHDLQEPLRMVSSYLQLLSQRYKGKLDADADDFIGYAVDGAERMRKLINDLLTYSRVSTHGKDFEPTDCCVVLKKTLANLQVAVEESNAVVTYDPLPTVMGDEVQLVQLLQNLIGNAVKFHGEELPHVHISAEKKEKEWVFFVRDNGIGVEPEYVERIFGMFQRLHSREKYPGTGMGLAICRKIVERHGGHIWVESEPGNGSTFRFTLPVMELDNYEIPKDV
jgi:light-regulated signal transduction histidine kinase (bacteriophytochrome)